MKLIRSHQARSMPWKNGGGVTHEFATFPEGAGLADFGWRISMAEVAADGPFSAFPGIDRTLALMAGQGIALTVDGAETTVDAGHPMLSFDGGAASFGRLLDGPMLDLNIMTRRGHWLHALRLLETRGAPVEVTGFAVICRSGRIAVRAVDGVWELGPRDCLIAGEAPDAPDTLTVDGTGTAYVLDLEKVEGAGTPENRR
ncbi:HutD family protein [Paracoccus pacificus]|uniref:HutD family protein n=1 Tax=Paracoccus pacificus TaxID=1463598 RepID=A0ABW4RAR0_9RHOB